MLKGFGKFLPGPGRARGFGGVWRAPAAWLAGVFILVSGIALWRAPAVRGVEIYVAPDGRDLWSGSLPKSGPNGADGPVATLERARELARARAKKSGKAVPVTVFLRQGVYRLAQPFNLEAADSGGPTAKVVYGAYPGERPVISGGMQITGFRPWKGKILSAKVAWPRGVKPFHELYYQDERQILARQPNFEAGRPVEGGWAYVAGKPVAMGPNLPNDSRTEFDYHAGDLPDGVTPGSLEVFIFPRYNWRSNIQRVAGIDSTRRHVRLALSASYAIRPGDRFCFQNALELLDAPGEWYFDASTSTLYFWPPADDADPTVEAPLATDLIRVGSGAHDIVLRGLTLENAAGPALQFTAATNCLAEGNLVRNLAGFNSPSVVINLGSGNGFVRNRLTRVGADGVLMSGGDVDTLAPGGNYVENNEIDHYGIDRKDTAGIRFSGVGLRVSHNFLHDAPRWAVCFNGNGCLVEYNKIQDVCLETSDTGAIYTDGRNWLDSRGTIIRFNWIERAPGFGQKNGVWSPNYYSSGVYLDDNAGGVTVHGNVFDGLSWCGVSLHEARDSVITNNLFLECGGAEIGFTGWLAFESTWRRFLPDFERNYDIYSLNSAWRRSGWLNSSPADSVAPDGNTQIGNRVENNIFAFRNPDTVLYQRASMSLKGNFFDHNLVWGFGRPVNAGEIGSVRALSTNLLPEISFAMTNPAPADWVVRYHARDADVSIHQEPDRRSFAMEAGTDADKPEAGGIPLAIDSPQFAARPGEAFELSLRVKAAKSTGVAQILALYYNHAGYQFSLQKPLAVRDVWETNVFRFSIPQGAATPATGELDGFRIRLASYTPHTLVWFDPVGLRRIQARHDWAAWRDSGTDIHSVMADPGFVDLGSGDYRLVKGSPALKVGFHPLPFDQMGLTAEALRAGWPLRGTALE